MKNIWLAGWHDRHTDDQFIGFLSEEEAKFQCHRWKSTYRNSYEFEERDNYGSWCLFCSDDYYMFIQEIKVEPY